MNDEADDYSAHIHYSFNVNSVIVVNKCFMSSVAQFTLNHYLYLFYV